MTVWIDSFTHDYFNDGTYSFSLRDTPGSFSVGSGSLLVSSDIGGTTANLYWLDPRATGISSVEVVLSDPDSADGLQLGLAGSVTDAINLVNEVSIDIGPTGSGTAILSWNGTVSFGGSSISWPPSVPTTLKLDLSGTTVTLSVNGTVVDTQTVDSSVVPLLPTLHPWSWVVPAPAPFPDPPTVTLSEWSYDATTITGGGGGSGPQSIKVTPSPDHLAADGSSTANVTATVKDSAGNPVVGETVKFQPSGQFGATTDHGDGTYTATYTASTVVGRITVLAQDGLLTASTLISQGAGGATGDIAAGHPKTGVVRV